MVVLLLFLLSPAAARADLSFSCDGSGSDPCSFCGINDTLCVFVDIDAGVTDLRGASLVLQFDPAIVTPISVEAWDLTAGSCPTVVFWLNQTTFTNTIQVDLAGQGCSVAGPGSILRICFTGGTPNMEGTSPFFCVSSLLRDSLNQPIPHVCGSALLSNLCPVPTQESTWSGLKQRFQTILVRND